MYFTGRRPYDKDPRKCVYTVVVNAAPIGQVCGSKGHWQWVTPDGLDELVYFTRDIAGEALAAKACLRVPQNSALASILEELLTEKSAPLSREALAKLVRLLHDWVQGG